MGFIISGGGWSFVGVRLSDEGRVGMLALLVVTW